MQKQKSCYQDAACQTDVISTETRSTECSILRPQFSRADREVKRKYYDLPEDYRTIEIRTASDKPKSCLIKKASNLKLKAKKPGKVVTQQESQVSDLGDDGGCRSSQRPEAVEMQESNDEMDVDMQNAEHLIESAPVPAIEGMRDESSKDGEAERTASEQVTVTGEAVEDELQRAMVEGFLTMYAMKSNGEMLIPVGNRDIDLLQEEQTTEASGNDNDVDGENGSQRPKKKKDYEKLAPYKYFCQKCSFKTKRESHFMKHVQLHNKHPVYRCDKCDFSTLTFIHLRKHEIVHSSTIFQCSLCPYTTVNNRLLMRHHRNRHSDKASTNKKVSTKMYQCTHCDYKTTSQLWFTRHSRSHAVVTLTGAESFTAVYTCDQCPYKTCRKEHFRRHVDNVHSNQRPHLCDFCGKSFNRTDNLQTHKQIHMDRSHGTYPYYCNICNRTFRTKGHLKEHAVIHSTERQYLCEICGASFKTRSVQRKHVETIHLNAGAFSCSQCPKTFSTKHAMKRHMKTHDTPGMLSVKTGATEVLATVTNSQVIQELDSFTGQTVSVVSQVQEADHVASEAIDDSCKTLEQTETFEQIAEGTTSYVATQGADGRTTLLYLTQIQ